MQRPERERKLCVVLLESIDETLTGLLSPQVVDALYLHLTTTHSIPRDQIPYRLETLSATLNKVFGRSQETICKAIARKFYTKLGLAFTDNPGGTLIEYVEEAKIKLGNGEGQL